LRQKTHFPQRLNRDFPFDEDSAGLASRLSFRG
jgi:hypothetical protein